MTYLSTLLKWQICHIIDLVILKSTPVQIKLNKMVCICYSSHLKKCSIITRHLLRLKKLFLCHEVNRLGPASISNHDFAQDYTTWWTLKNLSTTLTVLVPWELFCARLNFQFHERWGQSNNFLPKFFTINANEFQRSSWAED